VPTVAEWAETDADRRLFQLYGIKYEMSYPLMVAPGVPAERVAALRSAFDAAMADQQYRAEAKQIGIEINPLRGLAMNAMMKTINDMPDDLVARLAGADRRADAEVRRPLHVRTLPVPKIQIRLYW